MSDNPVTATEKTAEETVEEVAPPPKTPEKTPEPSEPAGSNRPSWVDEILDAIHTSAPDPVTPDPGTAPEPIAPDETPVRKPWTHWGRR